MRLHVRFSTLPIPLLEGIIKQNERELTQMAREREKTIHERKVFGSFYDLLFDQYHDVFHETAPKKGLIIGTAVSEMSAQVQGIPSDLSPGELVLYPYWNSVTLFGARSSDERKMRVSSSDERTYVDNLSLVSKARASEGWILSELVVPLTRIYTFSPLDLSAPVTRQVHARCYSLQETTQKTA